MALPTRGQHDWDDELNNEIQRLDSDVQTAVADSVSAKADAAYAKSKSDEAVASVGSVAAAAVTQAETAATNAAASKAGADNAQVAAEAARDAASGSASAAASSASDAAASAVAAAVPTDTRIANLVGDSTSSTATALNAAYVHGTNGEAEGSAKAAVAAAEGGDFALAVTARSLTTPAATLDLESPYELSGQYVHPDVYYNPVGWNGKKYWMAATPYARSNGLAENPVILVSDDGLTWTYPSGAVNQVVDPVPAGTALNSDPDIVVVGGTMYLYYREHSSSPLYEKIMCRTSTDGISWSTEQVVIDTTPDAPASRLRLISPAVIHDGSQFVMYYSDLELPTKRVMRRTSTDGISWSTPTPVIATDSPNLPFASISHTDVYRDSSGYWMALQDEGALATGAASEGARKVWLGTSPDGIAWTFDADPVLDSTGFAQLMVYRTSLIREERSGKDWLRMWVSGFLYAGDDSSFGSYVGYVEGFRPSQSNAEQRDLHVTGGIVSRRHVRAREVGADRIFGRFIAGAKARFDRVMAYEVFANHIRFRRVLRGSDTASDVNEWRMRVDSATGDLVVERYNGTGWDRASTITSARKLVAPERFETPYMNATGTVASTFTNVRVEDIGLGANPNAGLAGVKVNLNVDNIRIVQKRTPTGTADAALYAGCVAWDDNYLYVKTSGGWKRASLTSW